jgi:protein-tyrosine-phosphatase
MCRSVHTELRIRSLSTDIPLVVSSAGVNTEPGEAACPQATDSPNTHRSRQIDDDLLEAADLVLVMESSHKSRIVREHVRARRKVFKVAEAQRLFSAVVAELAVVSGGGTSEWLQVPAGFEGLSHHARMLWLVDEAHNAREYLVQSDPDMTDTHGVPGVTHRAIYSLLDQNLEKILGSLRTLNPNLESKG